MDDENAGARRPGQDLECRPPLQGDVVVGGFAENGQEPPS